MSIHTSTRLDSLKVWEETFGNAFPIHSGVDTDIKSIICENQVLDTLENWSVLLKNSTNSKKVSVAGRIMLFRSIGKLTFLELDDNGYKIQIIIQRGFSSFIPDEEDLGYKMFNQHVDIGDWITIVGYVCKTQSKTLSILAYKIIPLCKAVVPLPDKHKGIHDVEIKYRKRWLDLISNPGSRSIFKGRAILIHTIRQYMHNHGFMEVETPILSSSYGGANAKPFMTHINALNVDNYLRISLEIPLKKLLVGGFNAIYEIGKVFRNESIDCTHLPEYTSMEAYKSFVDYRYMLSLVENLCYEMCLAVNQKTKILGILGESKVELDFGFLPWKTITISQSLQDVTGLDINNISQKELAMFLDTQNFVSMRNKDPFSMSKGSIIMELFDNLVESTLISPVHVIDYPIESTPLAKIATKQYINGVVLVERFESYILGCEIANAYSELNDPILQRKLLEAQILDVDGHPIDEEFLDALSVGMPPAGGVGIGIDRLVCIMCSCKSIKDVVFFPLMKPENTLNNTSKELLQTGLDK